MFQNGENGSTILSFNDETDKRRLIMNYSSLDTHLIRSVQ